MKKIYDRPEIEILLFDDADILTVSGERSLQGQSLMEEEVGTASYSFDADTPNFDVYNVEDVVIK